MWISQPSGCCHSSILVPFHPLLVHVSPQWLHVGCSPPTLGNFLFRRNCQAEFILSFSHFWLVMTSLSLVWSSNPGTMFTHACDVLPLMLEASVFTTGPVLQIHFRLWHVLFGWHCGLHNLPAFLQEQLFLQCIQLFLASHLIHLANKIHKQVMRCGSELLGVTFNNYHLQSLPHKLFCDSEMHLLYHHAYFLLLVSCHSIGCADSFAAGKVLKCCQFVFFMHCHDGHLERLHCFSF